MTPAGRHSRWHSAPRQALTPGQQAFLHSGLFHAFNRVASSGRPEEAVPLVVLAQLLVHHGGIGELWRAVPLAFAMQDTARGAHPRSGSPDVSSSPALNPDDTEPSSASPRCHLAAPSPLTRRCVPVPTTAAPVTWSTSEAVLHTCAAGILQVVADELRSGALLSYVSQVVSSRKSAGLQPPQLAVVHGGLAMAACVPVGSPRLVVAASPSSSPSPKPLYFSRRTVSTFLLQTAAVRRAINAFGLFPATRPTPARHRQHLTDDVRIGTSHVPLSCAGFRVS